MTDKNKVAEKKDKVADQATPDNQGIKEEGRTTIKAINVFAGDVKDGETSTHWGVEFTRNGDVLTAELPVSEANCIIECGRAQAV